MKTPWLLLLVAAVSCKREAPPPPPAPVVETPTAPPSGSWTQNGLKAELRFGGSAYSEMEVFIEDYGGSARVETRLPFRIGETEYPAPKRPDTVKVPLAFWLGDLDLDELRDGERSRALWKKYRGKKVPDAEKVPERKREPVDWRVPAELALTRDGSKWWKGMLPPFKMAPAASYAVLKGEGPLVFEGDDAAPAKPDTLFMNFEFGKPSSPLLGKGTRLRDVDWVARSEWKPTGKQKKCGGYSRVSGVPGNLSITVSLDEVNVRVIDRRTGAVLGSKVFPPQSTCPGAANGLVTAVGAKPDDIIAWLNKQLAAGKVTSK